MLRHREHGTDIRGSTLRLNKKKLLVLNFHNDHSHVESRQFMLPPTLFHIYVKPVRKSCHQYGDGTQICITLDRPPTATISVFHQCLEMVVNWRSTWRRLTLASQEAKVLEEIMLSNLDSITSIPTESKCIPLAAFHRYCPPFVSTAGMAMLIHPTVTSWLDYCNELHVAVSIDAEWGSMSGNSGPAQLALITLGTYLLLHFIQYLGTNL